jgi:large subunit ribosomal protein L17
MRHRRRRGKLNITLQHQRAMGRNLVASLFEHGEIRTTLAKAKAFRPFAEKLITMARKGNIEKAKGTALGTAAHLHQIRQVAALMPHKPAVRRLFRDVAPAVGDRPGGYTRVLRFSHGRLGDNASMAMLMLVDKPSDAEAVTAEATEEAT